MLHEPSDERGDGGGGSGGGDDLRRAHRAAA